MLGHYPKVPVATSYTYSLFDEYTFVKVSTESKTLRGHLNCKIGEVQLSVEIGGGGLKFRKTELYNYY